MTELVCAHCGAVNEVEKPTKTRSTPQHRRMFALFKAAYFHWCESHHTFRPKNQDHLRYYLEMRAGHFDVEVSVRVNSTDPDKLAWLLTTVLRRSKDDCMFVDLDGDLLTVKRTKSISYASLPHKEACQLFDAISEVLAAEGFEPDKLLKETEAAA